MPSSPANPRRSWWSHPLTALLLVSATAYIINYNGISSSNDGSQFALLRAIAERGELRLPPSPYHERYTLGVDFAVSPKNGGIYSDRPPGTAFLLALVYCPFYRAVYSMGIIPDESLLRFVACFANLLVAVANVGLVYWVSRLLGCSRRSSWIAAAVFAFAGFNLKYSTLIFSHLPSATTLLLSAGLLLRPAPRRAALYYSMAGFVLGYGVLIEYQNAIPAVFFFLLWGLRLRREGRLASLALIALGGAAAAALLAAYHFACFGRVICSTHSFNPVMPHNQSLFSIFSGNLVEGLAAIFWLPPTGMLLYTPVFVFGVLGLFIGGLRGNKTAWGILGLAAIQTLLLAKHLTIIGGGTQDCRYVLPVTALAAMGFAPFLDWIRGFRSRAVRAVGALLFAFVLVFSIGGSMKKDFELKCIDFRHSCPLHPEFSQRKAGECPICGQALLRPPAWKRWLILFATVGNPRQNVDLRYFEVIEIPKRLEDLKRMRGGV